MKLNAAGHTHSNAPKNVVLASGLNRDTGSGGAVSGATSAPTPDRIDRVRPASLGNERDVAVQIPDHPQGDVYASEGHAAIWQAYYLQRPDGFSSGRGPKPTDQMAFIIKRQLQRDFDEAHVPIHFRAVAQPRESAAAYIVSGRDASESGIDVTINKDGSTQMTPYELGKREDPLKDTYRWHPEKHDTGYLERLIRGFETPVWVPDNSGNVMTGKDL